jgi:hypothetical protein
VFFRIRRKESTEPLTREPRFDTPAEEVMPPGGTPPTAPQTPQAGEGGGFRAAIRSYMLARPLGLLIRPHWMLLLLIALVVSRGITKGEFYFDVDETRHAMNGVFMHDLMVDMPLKNPMQYAYEYYAKYPAIALPHWPPFFAFVEGIFFLPFGISVWAGRLAVMASSLLGVYFWYRIGEEHGPRSQALLSGLIFALLPQVLLYESIIMLEIPRVVMCLGASYFWFRFIRSERALDLWGVAAFSVASFLTSQLAIFLVFFFGLHLLTERRFGLLRRWDVWIALLTSLAVVLPWYLLSFRTLRLSYQRATGQGFRHVLSWKQVSYYFGILPEQLGPVLLCLSLIGLGWALFRSARRYRFLLLWVASSYLCFTLIAEKEPRHIMIWLPPLVYFALLGVELLFRRPRWVLIASAVLAFYFLVAALHYHRPTLIGVEQAARFVLSQPESDVVYYQGPLNGDFIFFVRKFDPEKRHMVVREKQVVVTNVAYEQRRVLQTTDEVLKLFRTWGIRYAVVDNVPYNPYLHGLEPVQRLLLSDRFELVRVFPLWTNDPSLVGRTVSLYRYRGELERTEKSVIIPMLTIRSNIRVDLNRLAGRPWPN